MKDNAIVFEGPLCCSNGVCGPEPDKALIEFDEILKKLKRDFPDQKIRRAGITLDIEIFLENDEILQMVKTQGAEILPITTLNGKIVAQKKYLNYEEFQIFISKERQQK